MIDTTKVPQRSDVAIEHTWDLGLVFADAQAWEQELAALEARVPDLAALQGRLGENEATLLQALTLRDEIAKRLYALYVYARHFKDSDGTNPLGQALNERAGAFVARASAALAFIDPEILNLPEATLTHWLSQGSGLAVYSYEIQKLNRQRTHIRSAEVESVMAAYGDITRAPYEIFEMLSDSDMVFPNIADEKGQQVQLSHARYGRFIESTDRRVRHDAFKGLYSAYKPFRNTIATALAAQVRTTVMEARLRHYGSALEAALFPNEIPLEVYHNLITTIQANLPRLHRYMAVRKKLMGLEEQRIYDLYASPVADVEISMPYSEAQQITQAAFAPLGPDYAEALHRAFGSRWIDVYENVGKRSGAYSGGSYSTPPFILLNYQDRLDDMFTLAHELGHSMHSYFTRRSQPFVYGSYTIFVAEVASTLNEALLTRYLLDTRDDAALRRRLLVQQLEDIRRTIFRQTMFANFELSMHQSVEAGAALTAEALTERYFALVGKYHGPDVVLDEEIGYEWARIPHFYYNFYVYQYATGLSAALALAQQITNEGQPAVDRYLNFLSGGSARSSIDLLREAGVDMTSPAPIQAAMDSFERLVGELEQLA
jgi:oligoendopeptidase F